MLTMFIPQVPIIDKPIIAIIQEVKQEEKKPQLYTIKQGDNLTKISEAHSVDLSRLWAANPQLTNPDLIEPETALKIPLADEVLADRPLPATIQSTTFVASPQLSGGFSSAGNTYAVGWCTHFAKAMRPDLPNNLGNAATWTSRAAAQGFATGSVPRVGAIGQQGNHVTYVIAVNSDGSFRVREQNYVAFNTVSERDVASASGWSFIY